MTRNHDLLWPYSKLAAIVLAPITLIVGLAFLAMTTEYWGWPDANSSSFVGRAVLAVSFVPLLLLLLDFVSSRRASVDMGVFKLDFTHIDLGQPTIRPVSAGIPVNIGVPGAIIADSSPMQILTALEEATANEVVVIDLRDGNAWWVTRLLAVSAGAARAGSPKAIVFVGTKAGRPGIYLGWIRPTNALQAILASKEEYQKRYELAWRITRHVLLYDETSQVPTNLTIEQQVKRYVLEERYRKLGADVFEQILMDQLALQSGPKPDFVSLEQPPDRLTLNRLNQLFEHCLYQDQIDLDAPRDEQIWTLLDSDTPYLALVRKGRFETLLDRTAGERLILRELHLASRHEKG